MTYVTHAAAFALGFSLAVLLICRVTMRPQARKLLKQAGLVKQHKAKVPKQFGMHDEDTVVWDD